MGTKLADFTEPPAAWRNGNRVVQSVPGVAGQLTRAWRSVRGLGATCITG